MIYLKPPTIRTLKHGLLSLNGLWIVAVYPEVATSKQICFVPIDEKSQGNYTQGRLKMDMQHSDIDVFGAIVLIVARSKLLIPRGSHPR